MMNDAPYRLPWLVEVAHRGNEAQCAADGVGELQVLGRDEGKGLMNRDDGAGGALQQLQAVLGHAGQREHEEGTELQQRHEELAALLPRLLAARQEIYLAQDAQEEGVEPADRRILAKVPQLRA